MTDYFEAINALIDQISEREKEFIEEYEPEEYECIEDIPVDEIADLLDDDWEGMRNYEYRWNKKGLYYL